MKRGGWVVVVIIVLAGAMGLAAWPLMRLRRRNEIYKTEVVISSLEQACKNYILDHGVLPESRALDSWGRPFQYRYPGIRNPHGVDIWSLGPDPDDPSDDIWAPARTAP